jgi:hypothetical protein
MQQNDKEVNHSVSNTKTNSFIINEGEKGDICYAVCAMIIHQTGIVQSSLSIGESSATSCFLLKLDTFNFI